MPRDQQPTPSTAAAEVTVPAESLDKGIVKDIPLAKLDGLVLRILQGYKLFVINGTTNAIPVKEGTWCAGFLKGKWHRPNVPQDKDMLAQFTDASTMVLHDKDFVSLGKLIEARRVCKGDAQIRNYTIVESPTEADPGFFTLEASKANYWEIQPFKIENELGTKSVSQAVVAAALPTSVWQGVTGIYWHVRWATCGLSPIKPAIWFSRNFSIPGGSAIQISATS